MTARAAMAALAMFAGPAAALDLPAAAVLAESRTTAAGTLFLPTGPYSGAPPGGIEREGSVTLEAYRIPGSSLTPLQLTAPLRDQLVAEGQDILYECRDRDCGGFDFRFALDLLPEPYMHVDLGNFRYLAAEAPDGAVTGIVASRGSGSAYLHVTRTGPEDVAVAAAGPAETAAPALSELPVALPADPARIDAATAPGQVIDALTGTGRAILSDLAFATGSAALEDRNFTSLVELAQWLAANSVARVVLVGHSDAVGDLDINIDLSRRRAQAVVERLVAAHGVGRGQVRAEGVGYLAPVAPNTTPEGRAANRRVEVVRADPG